MAYIGSFPADKTSGSKPRNEFAGDGSTVNFTLSQEVPGGFESNVLVIVDNVLQQPVESYTIGGDNLTLQFSEAPASGAVIYVLHQGNATYQMIPVVGSVTPDKLSENLRNFTVDTFTGNGSTVAYTLTDTPASANSILVIVDGIFQTKTTNYTLSGTTLTFTGAPDSGAAITVIHLGFSTVSRTAVPDGSITTAKIADNAITSAKLGFDVIVAEDIAANAITVSELQNGAVTPAKLSTGGPSWDTSGNLGIGGTSSASATGYTFVNAIGSNGGSFETYSGTTRQAHFYSDATDAYIGSLTNIPLKIKANNSTAMTIATSGRVGIGITTPSSGFGVKTNGANGIVLETDGTDSTSSTRLFGKNNTSTGGIFYYHNSGNPMWCLTNAATVGSATGVTNLTVSQYGLALGNYDAATSGIGIKFPATQSASSDANTLDDYEEGTWTPQLWQGSTQITSVTSAFGYYVKVGKMLFIGGYVYKNGGAPSASGDWQMRGLPFSVLAGNGATAAPATYMGVNGSQSTQAARFQANTSTSLSLYGQFANTSWTTSYVEMAFSGCLQADS